jgi:uncharacterized protein YbjT (DUF2867 family)
VPQCEYLRVLRRRRPSEQGKPGQHLNKEPIDQTNGHDRRSSDVTIAQVKLDGRILDRGTQHLAGPGVKVARGDVRDPASLAGALRGAGTVISAVQGFAGPGGVSLASVDRAGNAHLVDAAARIGAAFVLVSVVGAAPGDPMELFRAKHAAEEMLRASGIPWTIVRGTAFMETWGTIMARPLQASGRIPVFGRGDNPVNFVSATDVAALVSHAATAHRLRGQILELGGPGDLTFNQVAAILQETTGRRGAVRPHPPRSPAHDGYRHGQAEAGTRPPGPRRARHGHHRHDLRPGAGPAGIPRPAEHRHANRTQRTARLNARNNRSARPLACCSGRRHGCQ